jgi:predicted alpha/beta hydrolase family esterase
MKNAIILHGAPEKENYYDASKPSESNAHWLPWLQKELLIRNIAVATPEVPLSFEPKWQLWCKEIERYDIGPETILVGHSAGGGFWAKYLSQHPEVHAGPLFLIAPWLDPDKTLQEDFFAGDFDVELVQRTQGITVYISDDDSESVQKSVQRIREEIPGVKFRQFSGYGHFTYENLKGVVFTELLEDILKS